MNEDLIGLEEFADLLRGREGPPQPLRRSRRRRSARSALVVAVLALAVATGVTLAVVKPGSHEKARPGTGGSGSSAVCAAAVQWHGTTYFGTAVHRSITLGRSLGKGTLPPCNDTNAGGGTPAQSVSLVAVGDIPPRQAVALAADPSNVYVAPGYFPQLPTSALHDLLYGARRDLPNERGSTCKGAVTRTRTVRGKVEGATFGFGTLRVGTNAIFVDAGTVVVGAGADPHVVTGEPVRAQVFVCRRGDDPHFLKLVATRLFLGDAARHG